MRLTTFIHRWLLFPVICCSPICGSNPTGCQRRQTAPQDAQTKPWPCHKLDTLRAKTAKPSIQALKAIQSRNPNLRASTTNLALPIIVRAITCEPVYLEKVTPPIPRKGGRSAPRPHLFFRRQTEKCDSTSGEGSELVSQAAHVDASYVLGISYIQTMAYDNARKAFAAMYGVQPDSAASHLFLARMLSRQGYDTVAEEEARKAIATDPKLPLAHFMLGEMYIFKSRIPEAIKELEAELAINPANAATYYRLADAYTRVTRWEDAEHLLQQSIWLDATASGPLYSDGQSTPKKRSRRSPNDR